MADSVAFGGRFYKRRKEFIAVHRGPQYIAPELVSLNYDQGQTAGGGQSIVLTGSSFTGATSVDFGAYTATYVVDSDSQITATLPAGSAGVVGVTVTGPGGTSGALSFEFWDPSLLSPKLWAESPDYSESGGNGTFVDNGSLLANFVNVISAPVAGLAPDGTPAPDFNGTTNTLTSTALVTSGITGTNGLLWTLFYADTTAARPTYDGNLLGDDYNATIGLSISNDGVGFTILDSTVSYTQSPAIACGTGSWNLALGMIDAADTGNEGKIALNGSGWTSFTATGGFVPLSAGNWRLGRAYTAHYHDGRIASAGIVDGTVSNANVVKLRKYLNQKFGVSV